MGFLSALFAGATAVLAKIGVKDVHSSLATAIRTVVILVFAWAVALFPTHQPLSTVPSKTWLFLVLSGLATGASWLCYFRPCTGGGRKGRPDGQAFGGRGDFSRGRFPCTSASPGRPGSGVRSSCRGRSFSLSPERPLAIPRRRLPDRAGRSTLSSAVCRKTWLGPFGCPIPPPSSGRVSILSGQLPRPLQRDVRPSERRSSSALPGRTRGTSHMNSSRAMPSFADD